MLFIVWIEYTISDLFVIVKWEDNTIVEWFYHLYPKYRFAFLFSSLSYIPTCKTFLRLLSVIHEIDNKNRYQEIFHSVFHIVWIFGRTSTSLIPLTTFSPCSPVPSVTDLQPRFRRCLRRLTPELNCRGDKIKRIEKRSGGMKIENTPIKKEI